jgi:hypothetical protein
MKARGLSWLCENQPTTVPCHESAVVRSEPSSSVASDARSIAGPGRYLTGRCQAGDRGKLPFVKVVADDLDDLYDSLFVTGGSFGGPVQAISFSKRAP